jgi:hypothetical protein
MDDPFDGIVGRSDREDPDRNDVAQARKLIDKYGGDAVLAAERYENLHRTNGSYLQALMWSRVKKAVRIELAMAKGKTGKR